MQPLIKNIIKNSLVGAAVGVLLSFVLPGFATTIGIPHAVGELGNPLWMAGFFGSISGATTAIQPLFDMAFGDKPTDVDTSPAPSKEPEKEIIHSTVQPIETRQPDHREVAAFTKTNISFSAVATELQRRTNPQEREIS